jgi:hypothetical protein
VRAWRRRRCRRAARAARLRPSTATRAASDRRRCRARD